jgi:tRNA U34 5-carboxymethylaminomethyl modifying GTPase MnmE/TrmE
MQKYAVLKEEVLARIVQMSALEHLAGFPLDEFTEKIRTNTLNLVVVGQFKRGKTCLINALMGVDLLPTGVVPLTSIVTVLTFGETLDIRVSFQDGTITAIDPQDLGHYVTEPGNPKNIKEVKEVFVSYPSPYLKDGVRLVDTPGVGSVYIHNTDVAYQYLPNSDAALFLLSVEQPVSKAELDFLKDVQQYSDKIFFLLNKIDYVTDSEIDESIAFTGRTIKEAAGLAVKVYPISAKLALAGKLEGSEELLKRSNLPAFAEVLNTFLIEEKGSILLRSVINNLLRILSQARLQLELEWQSLICPVDELQQKLQALELKKEEVLMEERNFDILLDGEIKRLIKVRLDEDLEAFKKELIPHMEQGFDAFHEDHKDLALKELNDALETYVQNQVEPAFNAWRMKEDDALARANQAICDRFAAKMNQIIDDLLEFSSQLFAVPFSSVKAESLWTGESNFSYKLKEEPVGLDMLTDSLTQVFPKYLSNRFHKIKAFLFRKANSVILGKRKRRMLELIEMQAGRMRYDFIARLSDSKQKFHREMVRKMRSTLEGIGTAMEKGMKQRAQGEKELLQRQSALSRELPEMDELRDRLLAVRESISPA